MTESVADTQEIEEESSCEDDSGADNSDNEAENKNKMFIRERDESPNSRKVGYPNNTYITFLLFKSYYI